MVSASADLKARQFSYEPEDVHNNNFKFAVLVPHTFLDATQGTPQQFDSFSYSFTQNNKKADPPYFLTTSIAFEFSPVTMMITKERKPFSRFVIDLCAIVGGVFVMFGILNSFVQSSKRTLRRE